MLTHFIKLHGAVLKMDHTNYRKYAVPAVPSSLFKAFIPV